MSAPVPQTKSAEIMDLINDLPAQIDPGSTNVRGIRLQLANLRKIDAASSYMVEGILFAKLGNLSGATSAHEKSLRLLPQDQIHIWNYTISLTKLSQFRNARDISEKLIGAGVSNANYIKGILWLSLISLDVERFDNNFRQVADRLSSKSDYVGAEDMRLNADIIRGFMEKNNDLKIDLDRVYSHVQSLLSAYRIIPSGIDAEVDNFYGQEVIHINYAIGTSAKDAKELNTLLLDKITEDDQLTYWDKIIANFVYRPKEEKETVGYASNA